MKKVSIQDIAKDLGMSRNTVSKALNNNKEVAYETRLKVQKRALELGYSKLNAEIIKRFEGNVRPDVRNVVVLINKQIVDFWNRIIIGISDELAKDGYNLILNCINDEDENGVMLPANIEHGSPDGIIVISLFKKEYIEKLLSCNIPIVLLDNLMESIGAPLPCDSIIVEGENSEYKMVTNLINAGYKRIGYIGYAYYCESMFLRWRGFQKAMLESNTPIYEEICFNDFKECNFYDEKEIDRCLSYVEKPDAFVCANDDIAINVIKYYKSKGYRIPKDIAITGFDDSKNAVVVEPMLTTAHIDNEKIGARLVQQLIWRINNNNMPYEKVYVRTKVVCRNSTI